MAIGMPATAARLTIMLLLGLLTLCVPAEAAEIRVLSANALRPALNELGPQFERTTRHTLTIEFDVIGVLKRKIDAGQAFDVALLTAPFIDDLLKAGKIAAGTRSDIARSGIGVIVRTGAARPDISSTDAFKRAMLSARSISYVAEGATALYLAGLFQRLGIAEQMRSKTTLRPPVPSVADGETELGLVVISAIEPGAGAELLGPLPPEIQSYVVYAGGLGAAAREAEAGKALIDFLRSSAVAPVLKAKGLEPTTP